MADAENRDSLSIARPRSDDDLYIFIRWTPTHPPRGDERHYFNNNTQDKAVRTCPAGMSGGSFTLSTVTVTAA